MAVIKQISKKATKNEAIPLEPNRNYSVNDAALALGISPMTVWRAIWAEALQTHRVGRRHIVSTDQIQTWLAGGGKTSRSSQSLAIAA
ncbi:MAG TPA: helix-turn-helix domain-containing protein [Blastocatellia bacterium]|nr:helix-turn-helix domain-containing protein [Blastocatellia bacterium]